MQSDDSGAKSPRHKEMMQNDSDSEVDQFDHDDCMLAIKALVEGKAILVLPQPMLGRVLKQLGDDAARVVKAEIEYHLRDPPLPPSVYYDGPRQEGQYRGTERADRYLEPLCRDLKLLTSLQGGPQRARLIVFNIADWVLQDGYEGGERHSVSEFIETAEALDSVILGAIELKIQQQKWNPSTWKPRSLFDEMQEIRSAWVRDDWFREDESHPEGWWEGYLVPNPVFNDSMRRLRKWHTEKVGEMLVMNIAGPLLPVELVEIITEYYVSRPTEKMDREEAQWMRYNFDILEEANFLARKETEQTNM